MLSEKNGNNLYIVDTSMKYQHLENAYMWGWNKSKGLMANSTIALAAIRKGA